MTYQPVRDARLSWERTQPQLFIEFPEPAVGDHKPAPPPTTTGATSPSANSPGGRRPDGSNNQGA